MRTADYSLRNNGLVNPADYKVEVVYKYDCIPGN